MSIEQMLTDEAESTETLPVAEGEYRRNRSVAKDPSQVYSLRIPVERLAELRVTADQCGVAPSALMRRWVLERLDREAELASAVAEAREMHTDEDVIVMTRAEHTDQLLSIVQEVVKVMVSRPDVHVSAKRGGGRRRVPRQRPSPSS